MYFLNLTEQSWFVATPNIFFGVFTCVLIAGFSVYLFFVMRKTKLMAKQLSGSRALQLQAYERLVLLVDRIALSNLVSRANEPTLDARSAYGLLQQDIKDEYDYNVTQQVYVSPDAWAAVQKLKAHNLLILRQVANALPQAATAVDFKSVLLEYLHQQEVFGKFHEEVSALLNAEAKKLLA